MQPDLSHLQAAPGGTAQPNLLINLIPYALILVVFYFLLIAPARKRAKKTQEMLSNLKSGDKIVTTGGILGTIVKASQGEDTLRIRIAPSVEIEVTRSAVAGLQSESPQGA